MWVPCFLGRPRRAAPTRVFLLRIVTTPIHRYSDHPFRFHPALLSEGAGEEGSREKLF